MNCLIITASGGSGHLIAAKHLKNAKESQNIQVDQIDILRSSCSLGKTVGTKITNCWENAQRQGNVSRQYQIVNLQGFFEFIFFPIVYFSILWSLSQTISSPTELVVTQPLHLFATLRAVATSNRFRSEKNQIKKVDLYFTDLPSEKAIHFFKSIARVHYFSKKSFDRLKIHSPLPSIHEDKPIHIQFNNIFKQLGSRARVEQYHVVQEANLPIDPKYSSPALPLPSSQCTISLESFTQKERDFMDTSALEIDEKDKVLLIMLGSIPEKAAILGYVDQIIEKYQNADFSNVDSNLYFFVACGKKQANFDENGQFKDGSLYKEVVEKIQKAELNPKVKIVPFIGQPVTQIFARSNLSITRSGGMTSGEIIALKSRDADDKIVCIHSSSKSNESESEEELLQKIPLWEQGNAAYLKQNYRAKIVSSKTSLTQLL